MNYTALIVDDNYFNRDIFRIALENAAYDVQEADDGAKALDLLKKQLFNLLVLDLQMPGIDGAHVLQQVRSDNRYRRMRIVVVTANSHMATDEIDNMADHVMFKPINVTAFASFVERLKRSYDKTGAL